MGRESPARLRLVALECDTVESIQTVGASQPKITHPRIAPIL
jgi:hypothetical protein